MHPVLILAHNCIELTKKCVESVQNQDIPTQTLVIDNGSTDGTGDWLPPPTLDGSVISAIWSENAGVSVGWNWGLDYWFGTREAEHVLVLNNDTILGSMFYKTLLRVTQAKPEVLFITGASTENIAEINPVPGTNFSVVPHPDFSAFLIRKEAWEKVGRFDDAMTHYASDNDWHVRAHRAGITLWNSSMPFYHERSSTLRNASPKDRREIELQADADREVFYAKWNCFPGDRKYTELFK